MAIESPDVDIMSLCCQAAGLVEDERDTVVEECSSVAMLFSFGATVAFSLYAGLRASSYAGRVSIVPTESLRSFSASPHGSISGLREPTRVATARGELPRWDMDGEELLLSTLRRL